MYNKCDFDYLQGEFYENNWINAHSKLIELFDKDFSEKGDVLTFQTHDEAPIMCQNLSLGTWYLLSPWIYKTNPKKQLSLLLIWR